MLFVATMICRLMHEVFLNSPGSTQMLEYRVPFSDPLDAKIISALLTQSNLVFTSFTSLDVA